MELAEERCLASLRSCEMGPDDQIKFKDYVTELLHSFDPDSICENNIPFMESILECSKKIRPPGKITTITVRWKLKENGFGHHLYLKWLPPKSIDSKIESYYVNINNYVFRTKSSIPKFEMDILDPESSEYRVRIVAANHYHMGPYSEWVVAKELKPHPAPPEHLYCIERHYNYLKFWWGDEKRDDVEFFTLEMRSGKCCYSPPMELFCEERDKRKELSFTPVYSGPSLSYKLEDLVPDTEYEIRIYATNFAGEAGPYSDVHTFSTSHAVPCTVRTFRVLTMMEIKELRIQKLSLGAKKYPPVILKLLLKARKYRPCPRKYPLRIREPLPRIREPLPIIREPLPRPPRRGQNKYLPPRAIRTSPAARKCYICDSEYERTVELKYLQQGIQLEQIPGAMRHVGVIPLVGGIHIRWLGPELTRCSFSYNVIIGNLSFNTNDNGTEIAIKGLDPDASYSIQIQAVNCDGPGPSSEVIQTRTRPGLPEPLQMKCLEACYNHLRLFWFSEEGDDNIISYRLEMLVLKRFKPIYHGPAVCCRAMRLEENTEYEFRACAFSLDGKGQYSDVYKFKTSSDTLNSSNEIVDQASSSAVRIEKATSYSKVMVQTATVSGMLRQTTSAFELMDQTATVSEIMEKVCPTPEVEKQTPVVDQDDHSSVNVEHVTFTSKMMKQSATASEVLEQTASAFELIGQTAIASEIMEQVYPTPKTENLVPVMDQAGPSSVVIEEVNPVSKVMEQTASTSEVMEQEETATASEVTEQAVTVSEVIELTISLCEIIKKMYPPLEARKQVALKPSSLLRSSEDKNDFMDERDDGLSGKGSKKNKECILFGNSSSCKFYKRRKLFEEKWMDTFMNYIQELPLPDTVRERLYVCPSSCFSFLSGFPHGCLNKTSGEMLHRAFDMTVNVDLFDKDLIVLPILVDHQWSMAMVCYPGLIPQKPEYEEETEYLNLVHRRFSTVVHGDKKDKESSTSEKSTASAQKAQQAKVPCFYIFPIDSNHDSSVIAHGLKSLLEQLWEHYKDTERVLDFKNVKIFEVDFSDVRDIEPEMKLLHITKKFLKQKNEGAKFKKCSKVPKLSGTSTKGLHMHLHIICDVNVLQRPSESIGLKTMDKETSEIEGSKSNSNIKNPVPCSNLESFYDYFKTEVKDTPTPPPPPPLDITAKKLFRFLYHVTSRDILDLAEWNPNTISQWEGSLNWC